MEKQLFDGRVLTLKELALRRTTVNLWIGSILDPRYESPASQVTVGSMEDKRSVIEVTVRDKISKLVVPESLKKQILCLVKPVGKDILQWISHCEGIFDDGLKSFDLRPLLQLRLTWLGAIDYRKTAEEFIRLGMMDVKYRFHLACIHCLEDEILLLWDKLPVELMDHYNRIKFQDDVRSLPEGYMVYYWIFVLRKEGYNLERELQEESVSLPSFYKESFIITARDGNKAATEYFLHKLCNDEKREALPRAINDVLDCNFRYEFFRRRFSDEKLTDVFFYLLSFMTPAEQIQIFIEHPCNVLARFMLWPLGYLFLEIIDIYWTFLPESRYDGLLSRIKFEMMRYMNDDDNMVSGYFLPNLFQEFFIRSPVSLKKCFVDIECRTAAFLSDIFLAVDTETIQVVFRNIDTADRRRLVFSEAVMALMDEFLLKDQWDVVEACVREATLSREDRGRLKRDFMEYMTRSDFDLLVECEVVKEVHKRKRFFEFLDEMDVGRGSAVGEPPTKKTKTSQ